jgi:uncharacterized phage protein gp47/JayE
MTATPSLQSLIYRAKATFKSKTGVDNPAIDAFAAVIGGIAFGQYAYSDYLFKQINPETCDEEWLYLHAERLKVPRISLTYAQGTCNLAQSANSTLVPTSVIFKTSAGNEYEVITATNSELPVPIRSITAGEEGNLPAGESLYLVTAVTGLHPESITSNDISGGAGLEELEHWRARVLLAYYVKNAVGRLKDYKFWAVSSHSDIDFAWAADNTPQLGHVTVYIAQAENSPLLPESVRIVAQDYIDEERLAGCHVFVTLPTLKPITVTILGVDDIDMRNSIDASLQNFFTSRIESREVLFSNEISTVISSITNQFTLVSPTATTTFLDNELLTYGGVVWQ